MPKDNEVRPGGSLHDVLAADLRADATQQGAPGQAPTAAALAAVSPRPVPSVVLSIAASTAAGVAEAIGRIPGQLDPDVAQYPVKIELRADTLSTFEERMTAAAVVLRLGVPIVVTLRSRLEGGQSVLSEPERQRFFLSLVGALRGAPPPGSIIDVEAAAVAADPEGWGQVIAQAREKGFHVMLSYHDLAGTPDNDHGLLPDEGLLDTVPGGPAAIWKAAATVQTWTDELALLSALRRGNAATRRAAIMGLGSATARLLSPFFAAPLVYASVDRDLATASGQLPFADLVRTWQRWGIQVDDAALAAPADDGRYPVRWALLGCPAWHSLSPAMHNAAARQLGLAARYFPIEIPAQGDAGADAARVGDTLLALHALGVVAGNVTVPFKAALAGAADELEGDAAALGVANTYRFDKGRLVAGNTDAAGVLRAVEAADVDVAGATVLVVGAGGSAAAALYGLRGASRLTVTNRTPQTAHELAARLRAAAGMAVEVVPWDQRAAAAGETQLIVQCTSVGMHGGPAPDENPLAGAPFGAGQTVLDLVYVPRETALLAAARTAGATVIEGTEVLLHQAALAFSGWTQAEPPIAAMRSALDAASAIPFPDAVRALGGPREAAP